MPINITENEDSIRTLGILNIDTTTVANGIHLSISVDGEGRITLELKAEGE